jgi:hypothetical protein
LLAATNTYRANKVHHQLDESVLREMIDKADRLTHNIDIRGPQQQDVKTLATLRRRLRFMRDQEAFSLPRAGGELIELQAELGVRLDRLERRLHQP